MDVLKMQEVLQSLLAIEENKVCADCQDPSKRVTHVSVNNSAFICSDCEEVHSQTLTPTISLVRPLDSDFWSEEQISTLQAGGGNLQFNNFMGRFDLNEPNCEH